MGNCLFPRTVQQQPSEVISATNISDGYQFITSFNSLNQGLTQYTIFPQLQTNELSYYSIKGECAAVYLVDIKATEIRKIKMIANSNMN